MQVNYTSVEKKYVDTWRKCFKMLMMVFTRGWGLWVIAHFYWILLCISSCLQWLCVACKIRKKTITIIKIFFKKFKIISKQINQPNGGKNRTLPDFSTAIEAIDRRQWRDTFQYDMKLCSVKEFYTQSIKDDNE